MCVCGCGVCLCVCVCVVCVCACVSLCVCACGVSVCVCVVCVCVCVVCVCVCVCVFVSVCVRVCSTMRHVRNTLSVSVPEFSEHMVQDRMISVFVHCSLSVTVTVSSREIRSHRWTLGKFFVL